MRSNRLYLSNFFLSACILPMASRSISLFIAACRRALPMLFVTPKRDRAEYQWSTGPIETDAPTPRPGWFLQLLMTDAASIVQCRQEMASKGCRNGYRALEAPLD